jgi:mutator protein MutT
MRELTILFLLRDNEILLAMKKRGFGAGRYNGVGGKVEPNETIEQAAVRECEEEIAVTPKQIEKVAEITFDEQHQGVREELRAHVFVCHHWTGGPVETEEMAPAWFAVDAIPYDQMWADDPFWLPAVLAGKRVSCRFTLDANDQVAAHEVVEVTKF